jgi:hypothetical protein
MMRLLTENIAAKLFSILIAFLLWAALVDEPELIETVTVPVEYRNLANHLDLSPDAPNRIQLQVRGPRGRLNEVSPDRTNIVLDLSGMSDASSRTFTIQADSINLPPTVSLVRAMPSQLRVKLERRLSKDLPVLLVYEEGLPASLKTLPASITPATIRVVGPESRILSASSIPTEPISRADLEAAKPIRVNVLLSDPELSLVGSPLVTVTLQTNPLPSLQPCRANSSVPMAFVEEPVLPPWMPPQHSLSAPPWAIGPMPNPPPPRSSSAWIPANPVPGWPKP